jgi:HAD superfamily hydrolase (TIGR01458 family)
VARIDAVLLDMDGVLVVSWEPLPGAIETIDWLREREVPFRLITNTTTHTRAALARTMTDAGIAVSPEEVITAVVATGTYLRNAHQGARVFVLSDGDARADLQGVDLVEADADADVVVLGGAYDGFDYPTMNRVFRMLMGGATLVAMHRNLYWRTKDGWRLDGGAYVAALEEATGRSAVVCGKPAGAFFASALEQIGVQAKGAAMVGDDLVNDVQGAQAAGLTGVLVRTGKFRQEDLDGAEVGPDVVIDSIAGVPELLAPL